MTSLVTTVRVVREAALVGYADRTSIFTLRAWLGGWLVRVVAQVVFFGLFGLLLNDPDATRFIVVGNVVVLATMPALSGALILMLDRPKGVLPFIVATPTSTTAALAGRLLWPATEGVLTAVLAAPVVFFLFDVAVAPADIPPLLVLLALTTLSVAGLSSLLGALLLHRPRWRNLGTNVVLFTFMIAAGVNVPLTNTPDAVATIGQLLPMTHGLLAIRAVLDGTGGAGALIARELATGGVWFVLSLPAFRAVIRAGRMAGTLEQG